MNLFGMSVDHFIGIVYPLKYRSWMNSNRAQIAIIGIWIVSVALGFADLPLATIKYLSQGSTDAGAKQPSVCSGNIISDIVDILENSDFLAANSELLFDVENVGVDLNSRRKLGFGGIKEAALAGGKGSRLSADTFGSGSNAYLFLAQAQAKNTSDSKLINRPIREAPVFQSYAAYPNKTYTKNVKSFQKIYIPISNIFGFLFFTRTI